MAHRPHRRPRSAAAKAARPAASCCRTARSSGPTRFDSMRVVPELVFVNCCHLGRSRRQAVSGAVPLRPRALRVERRRRAHRDRRALRHRRRLGGRRRCGERVRVGVLRVAPARQPVHRRRRRGARRRPSSGIRDVNTWAAYQCYGDPDWQLRGRARRIRIEPTAPCEDLRRRLGRRAGARTEAHLRGDALPGRRTPRRRSTGCSGSSSGSASAGATTAASPSSSARRTSRPGRWKARCAWYERAVAATDGKATVKAAEQLGNVRSRLGWETGRKGVAAPRRDGPAGA